LPAINFLAVTPSDSNPIIQSGDKARALYVGTGGDVALENASGDAVIFVGVPSGAFMPVYTARVLATDTTASDIVALF
jgi:hypothetical protein